MSDHSSLSTQAPGNTKPVAWRARAFQFTLNNVSMYEELKDYLTDLKSLDYFLSCEEEAPTTGHKHIHIYAHFNNPYKLSKKILNVGAHVEICRGSPLQNIKYIMKDGNILDEIGEPPHQGQAMSVKDLEEADINDCPASYYNIKEKIDTKKKSKEGLLSMLIEIKDDKLQAPEIFYITGPPGSGKTYGAYKRALEKYEPEQIGRITINNNFFSIDNEDALCFVIEEFRPSQLRASDLLQFMDKYGYKANTKGGFTFLRPKTIYICSVVHPKELYLHEELNEQFIRRITEIINM